VARSFGLVLVFALGLGLSCAVLRVLARRNPNETGGLLEHLAAHRADYDVVVIGSSFTRLHFAPKTFERRMRRLGHRVRAFGCGTKGLRGGELDYYIERVLELDMPKLRWLLVDVTLDQIRGLESGNYYKRRVIRWHGVDQVLTLHAALAAGGGEPLANLQRLQPHVSHLLLNLGNVGEGVVALRSDAWLGVTTAARTRGAFFPPKINAARQAAAGKRYAQHHPGFARWRQKLVDLRSSAPPPRDHAVMRIWRDRIRARGIEPVFVLSPILSDARFPTAVPGDEPLPVLDFNDPVAFPELYDPTLRQDTAHLHRGGAEVFSTRLADVLAERIARRTETPAAVTAEAVH
jgi:hypothetical protein